MHANGSPTGYVVYHVRNDKTGHPTRGQELVVKDLVWLNADAYRSLWSWLARHDLVGRITWLRAPVDDPAPELFVEPRLLNSQPRDGIWLRIVDARRHSRSAVIRRAARSRSKSRRTTSRRGTQAACKVECSPDGATVTPSRGNADITLSVKALASLYSGFRSARQLAQWGMLEGDDAAIERATRIFATRHAPHCPDNF